MKPKTMQPTYEEIGAQCISANLAKLNRFVGRLFNSHFRKAGINLKITQFTILVELARIGKDAKNNAKLAERLVMDRTTVTRNMASLEKVGLVEKQSNLERGNGRYTYHALTDKGKKLLKEKAISIWNDAHKIVWDSFDNELLENIRNTVSHLDSAQWVI